MTRRVFVIRHGNTFETSADACRIGAGTDIPLVASGEAQADRLGTYFAALNLPAPRLFSSALRRSRTTAQRIGAALGQTDIAALDWLNEIDHGPDEGKPEAEVIARIGGAALADWDERGVAPDDWTVDADRRIAAWSAFFAEETEGADLLVTSNGAARFALLMLDLPLASLKLRTGAFGEFEIGANAIARLVAWDVRP